jgi:hypothetical protein
MSSWFGKTKSRKPNLAEELLKNSIATTAARKARLEAFAPRLADYILDELKKRALVELAPTNYDFHLALMFNGEKKNQAVIDLFTQNKPNVVLPTFDETVEIAKLIKPILEEPTTNGLTVALDLSKIRVDWSTPTIPVEPAKVEPAKVEPAKVDAVEPAKEDAPKADL